MRVAIRQEKMAICRRLVNNNSKVKGDNEGSAGKSCGALILCGGRFFIEPICNATNKYIIQ